MRKKDNPCHVKQCIIIKFQTAIAFFLRQATVQRQGELSELVVHWAYEEHMTFAFGRVYTKRAKSLVVCYSKAKAAASERERGGEGGGGGGGGGAERARHT